MIPGDTDAPSASQLSVTPVPFLVSGYLAFFFFSLKDFKNVYYFLLPEGQNDEGESKMRDYVSIC